ncbi:hypothetical protein COB57_04950 [Candidatus Peregrinibacteria bacterium]|nr:MAG: hypothetical protein COB57_04950 [Candidatus Peregrinibacteria bacterium]
MYENQLEKITNEKQSAMIVAYKKYADETFDSGLEYENAVQTYIQVLEEKEEMYTKRSDQLLEATNVPINILFNQIEATIGPLEVETTAYDYIVSVKDVVSLGPNAVSFEHGKNTLTQSEAKINRDREIMFKLMAEMTSVHFSLYRILGDSEQAQKIIIAVEKGNHDLLLKEVQTFSDEVRQKIDEKYSGQYEAIREGIEANEYLLQKILEKEIYSDKEKQVLQNEMDALKIPIGVKNASTEEIENMKYDEDTKILLRHLVRSYNGYQDYILWNIRQIPKKSLVPYLKKLIVYSDTVLLLVKPQIQHLPENKQNVIRFSILSRLSTHNREKEIIEIKNNSIVLARKITADINKFTADEIKIEQKYQENKKNRKQSLTQIAIESLMGPVDPSFEVAVITLTDKERVLLKIQAKRAIGGHYTPVNVIDKQPEKIYTHDGFDFYKYPSDNIIVKKKGSVIYNVYEYYNSNKIKWEIDRLGILTYYSYSNGKVSRKIKMIASYFYNPETGKFNAPINIHQTSNGKADGKYIVISYTTFKYNDDGLLSEKIQRSPLKINGHETYKKIEYIYLGQERLSVVPDRDFNEEYEEQLSHMNPFLKGKIDITKNLLSYVKISDSSSVIRKNHFYYDRLLQLSFVEEFTNIYPTKTRFIRNANIEADVIEAQYKGIELEDKVLYMNEFSHVDDFQQLNPLLFLDSNGAVLTHAVDTVSQKEEIEQLLSQKVIDLNTILSPIPKNVKTLLTDDSLKFKEISALTLAGNIAKGFVVNIGEFTLGLGEGLWDEIVSLIYLFSFDTLYAFMDALPHLIDFAGKFLDLYIRSLGNEAVMLFHLAVEIHEFSEENSEEIISVIDMLKEKITHLTPKELGYAVGRIAGLFIPLGLILKGIQLAVKGLSKTAVIVNLIKKAGKVLDKVGDVVKGAKQTSAFTKKVISNVLDHAWSGHASQFKKMGINTKEDLAKVIEEIIISNKTKIYRDINKKEFFYDAERELLLIFNSKKGFPNGTIFPINKGKIDQYLLKNKAIK